MARSSTPSLVSLRILRPFVAAGDGELSGADIMASTGERSGNVYRVLTQAVSAGWLTSRWEDIDPRTEGRPRRRFYAPTPAGSAHLRALLAAAGSLALPQPEEAV